MNAPAKSKQPGSRFAIPAAVSMLALLSLMPAKAAGQEQKGDAIVAARFSITIDGYEIGSFSELQGITTKVDVIESTDPETKTMQVALRRVLPRESEMSAWHELVILGDVAAARKSCILTMHSSDGTPVLRYHLTNAWPSKIEIGALKDKSGTSVLTESVTLTCEFIQRVR